MIYSLIVMLTQVSPKLVLSPFFLFNLNFTLWALFVAMASFQSISFRWPMCCYFWNLWRRFSNQHCYIFTFKDPCADTKVTGPHLVRLILRFPHLIRILLFMIFFFLMTPTINKDNNNDILCFFLLLMDEIIGRPISSKSVPLNSLQAAWKSFSITLI